MRLDELLSLPRAGVAILIKDNQFLVSYTTSMGASLEGWYKQFKGHRGVTLTVRSVGADLETLKLHTEYYRAYYREREMTELVAPLRQSIRYKVRLVPRVDYKGVDVEIVSARGESRVVGKFKNNGEAREFIETYYGTDNPFCLPVYGANADTKAFLNGRQTKLLDIK